RGAPHPAAHQDPARADRAPVHREGEGGTVTGGDAETVAARVRMTGITVDFGPVRALHEVDLTLQPGEIHALMGENGAGKSTLVNVLAAAISPVAGRIVLDGREVRFSSAADAQEAGIAAVMQDVPLARHISIGENVMLGHEPYGRFGIQWNQLHDRAQQTLTELGLGRSEEHTSELQSRFDLVCRLLLEKKKSTTSRT